jgi:hypothetical protein
MFALAAFTLLYSILIFVIVSRLMAITSPTVTETTGKGENKVSVEKPNPDRDFYLAIFRFFSRKKKYRSIPQSRNKLWGIFYVCTPIHLSKQTYNLDTAKSSAKNNFKKLCKTLE